MSVVGPIPVEVMRSGLPVHAGAVLTPPPGTRTLTPGAGTERLSDGTVVASVSGLALIGNGSAVIYPADIIFGDVYRTVSVSASGNLVVMGKLQPGAVVRVGGSVLVRDDVHGASVEALGSVVLRTGCVDSQIQAGTTRHAYVQLVGRVEAVAASFRQLLGVIDQLHSFPQFRAMDLQTNLGPLLRVLFEQKFASFPLQMAQAIEQLQGYRRYGGPIASLEEILRNRFSPETLLRASYDDVRRAYARAEEVVAMFAANGGHRQDILIERDTAKSSLQASGTVRIAQGGLRQSQVKADTAIRVGGQVDGGTLTAGSLIDAAAATGGTLLEVGAAGSIRAGAMDQGTQVRVAGASATLDSPRSQVEVSLVRDRLQFAASQEVTEHV